MCTYTTSPAEIDKHTLLCYPLQRSSVGDNELPKGIPARFSPRMMPMTHSGLHEVAVRRQGDPDVMALLLEIRRLHGVLVEAHKLIRAAKRIAREKRG